MNIENEGNTWTVSQPQWPPKYREDPVAMNTMSDEQKDLEQALLELHQKMEPAVAREKGQSGSRTYSYANLRDDVEASRDLLCECGLVVSQWPVPDPNLAIVMTRMAHPESGQWRQSAAMLTPEGSHPQDWGSAFTYARRYSYEAVVGLSKVKDDDAARRKQPQGQALRQVPKADEPGGEGPPSPRKQLYYELQDYANLNMEDMPGALWLIARSIDKDRKRAVMKPTVSDGKLVYSDDQRRKAIVWVTEKKKDGIPWADLFTTEELLEASLNAVMDAKNGGDE